MDGLENCRVCGLRRTGDNHVYCPPCAEVVFAKLHGGNQLHPGLVPLYYMSLERLVGMIEEPNRTACRKILAENDKLFRKTPGSTNNHQVWPGGYRDHVQEGMNVAWTEWLTWNMRRKLSFSLSDALLVFFLHDLEKPWKYELRDGVLHEKPEFKGNKAAQHEFRMRKLTEYGITLTPEQLNGLKYVEGELADYSSRERKAGPLAIFCGNCDRISARIWFDRPGDELDPAFEEETWGAAKRLLEPIEEYF